MKKSGKITTGVVKVAIIDDDKSYRDSLKRILEKDDRITIYGEYNCAEDFLKVINSPFRPDVCLIDILLKKMSGVECCRIIREKYPDIYILIMTAYPDTKTFAEVRDIGADYMEKGTKIEVLIDKIITSVVSDKETHNKSNLISLKKKNENTFSYLKLANELEEARRNINNLSKTQIEVLKLRQIGKSVKEIAEILNIGTGTVHTHITRAMKKLSLPNLIDYILDKKEEDTVKDTLQDSD